MLSIGAMNGNWLGAGAAIDWPRESKGCDMAGTRLAALVVSMALCAMPWATVHAASPSFDCSKAGTWAEKTICQNNELAALDAWFTPLYGQVAQRLAGKDLDDLKARRKAWLKGRDDCEAEADGTECLKTHYQWFTFQLELKFAELVESTGAAQFARSPLADCVVGPPDCVERLIEAEEAKLADAEAKAGDAATQRDRADQNVHAADRLAEANVAWRAYRNAECKRREAGSSPNAPEADYSFCLVELTRVRVRELQ
jgi:uncharacterized protein YecT (DUF1311 family)